LSRATRAPLWPRLLQDSTALALHPALAKYFPGCGNQHQRSLASPKIQAPFELRSQRWIHFELGALTDNDQKASALILSHLQAGALVIRDLGYAVFEVWRQTMSRGAFFLSRCRSDFRLSKPHSHLPLDLLALLQDHAQLSYQVLLGVEELLPVRLVALRLPAPLAAQRRRPARANARRDNALRLRQRYLKLLDWIVLLTNIPEARLTAQQVLEFYNCRWQIEVLFKRWKSHFQIGRLPTSNPLQVHIHILAKLLAIALLQNLFPPNLLACQGQLLSPLKIAAYFSVLLPLIAASPHQNWFDHFCRYDSRHDRPNFLQKLSSLC
jgi:hypothetical protein